MDIWNFFAVFGTYSELSQTVRDAFLLTSMLLAFPTSFVSLLFIDRRLKTGEAEYFTVWKSVYTYFIVLPLIYVVCNLELLFLIVMSFSQVSFAIAIFIGVASYVFRFIHFDISFNRISAYGIVAKIQQLAVEYIILPKNYYPLQGVIESTSATHEIRSTQNKYLKDAK